MIQIAKQQLVEGLLDAKFLFMAAIVLIAFAINGFVYSERYSHDIEDWNDSVRTTTNMLEQRSNNLQYLAGYLQRTVKPPSALAFVCDAGEQQLPNMLQVNAFSYRDTDYITRYNDILPILPAVDWVFIVGSLMTLMAVLLSFGVICGEKRDGTLRFLLSYPISRLSIFAGKFIGLASVIFLTLLIGVAVNLLIIGFLDVIPLTEEILFNMLSAAVLSYICLTLFLLIGMAVSSMTARPAVSLVVLLIFWVISVVAIPGLGRLVTEQLVPVRSNFEIQRELESSLEQVRHSHPDDAGNWSGDPFADNVPRRAAWVQDITTTQQRLLDEALKEKIYQTRSVSTYSSFSPTGLLGDALERFSGTGISGFEMFFESCRRYQLMFHDYVEAKDAADPDTPHLLYAWWAGGSDPGVYSNKPVEQLDSVPRSHSLWRTGGFSGEQEWPLTQTLIYLGLNLLAAAVAFVALLRYDPR